MNLNAVDIERQPQGRDPLTGLPELHEFIREVERLDASDHARGFFPRYSCVYFNVRNFSRYNAAHGIGGGDECLRQIARILQSTFAGDLVCHLAADSFLALAPTEGVEGRVERACQEADSFMAQPGVVLKAGIRTPSADEPALGTAFFDQAKVACTSIRETSLSWARYDSEMDRQAKARDYVLTHFDQALAEGRIKVVFQPIVRSFTKKFCNSEALARWEAPDYDGHLYPDFFVRVLEDARLVHRLDLFVLEHVAQVLRYELDAGIPTVPISVNFSRLDFTLADIPAEVEAIVRRYDLAPHLVCVEITETALLQDPLPLRSSIERLRGAGFQVWLDDFGSGYSSLNVLENFDLDEVKLDIGFLRSYNERTRTTLAAVVGMAHALGLHTLAEGVETAEQADFLSSIGCEKMQGYFFAKPMGLDTAVDYPERRQITVETPREERLFTEMRATSLSSDDAIALFAYDGAELGLMYANQAYRTYIVQSGFRDPAFLNEQLRTNATTATRRFKDAIVEAAKGGRASMLFLEYGHYMRLVAERLSEADGLYLLKVRLFALDSDAVDGISLYDQQMRYLMSLYSSVYYVRVDRHEVEVIRSALPEYTAGDSAPLTRQTIERYCRARIHPADQERFLRFWRIDHIRKVAVASPSSEALSMFRVRRADDSFAWVLYDVLLISPDDGNLLVAAREDTLPLMDESQAIWGEYARSAGIPLRCR